MPLANLKTSLQANTLSQDTLHTTMTSLYQLIKQLMDETFKAQDPDLKAMLAVLEKKAREFLGEIMSKNHNAIDTGGAACYNHDTASLDRVQAQPE